MTRQSTFFRERMYSGGFVLLYICVYEGDSHAPALLICFVCASVYFRKELIQIIMCFKKKMVAFIKENLRLMSKELTWSKVMAIVVGTAIASFGIYNIHRQSGITEGGVLGMILVLNHWFGVSNSILTSLLDLTCYALAFKYLGGKFIRISIVSTFSMSAFFRLWEQFPPVLPNLSENPFLASVLGGIFVGIGVGIVVRQGGSSGGDDALALTISHLTKWRLSRTYMFTDFTVLALSLTYIPVHRILFSVMTTIISSNLIDWIKELSVAELPFVGGLVEAEK